LNRVNHNPLGASFFNDRFNFFKLNFADKFETFSINAETLSAKRNLSRTFFAARIKANLTQSNHFAHCLEQQGRFSDPGVTAD